MSAIHEFLYEHDDFSEIELADYIAVLARNLSELILRSSADLELDLASERVNPDIALPIGLIANELLTNAAKYAFPGGGSGKVGGRIAVRLARTGNTLELSVEDDGVGLPEGFDPEQTTTLGMSLVRNLALQLGGSVRFGGKPGLRVTVAIPLAVVSP